MGRVGTWIAVDVGTRADAGIGGAPAGRHPADGGGTGAQAVVAERGDAEDAVAGGSRPAGGVVARELGRVSERVRGAATGARPGVVEDVVLDRVAGFAASAMIVVAPGRDVADDLIVRDGGAVGRIVTEDVSR